MRLKEIFRSILLNIGANKMRSFLTTLGVIVGSLTIIIVVGIGVGGQKQIAEQYSNLNAEQVTIMAERDWSGMTLGQANLTAIASLDGVAAAGMSVMGQAGVVYGTISDTVTVNGITASMMDVNNLKLAYGKMFSDNDGEKRKKVVVLGYTLAETLFGEDVSVAVGKKFSLSGRKYEVVGVIERQGDSTGGKIIGTSVDDSSYVPYVVATSYIVGQRGGGMMMSFITASATSTENVELAIESIENFIYKYTGSDESYTVRDNSSVLETALSSAETMSDLLIAVAAVVLVVGGIGIMNVLLVSVRERTREIGILKSIGCKKRDILKLFLFEAVILSVGGGLVGAALSFAAIPFINYLGTYVVSSVEGIALGMIFSTITGIFFGFYPALKASDLKPIDALNYDG